MAGCGVVSLFALLPCLRGLTIEPQVLKEKARRSSSIDAGTLMRWGEIETDGILSEKSEVNSLPMDKWKGVVNLWTKTDADPGYKIPEKRADVKLVVGVMSSAGDLKVRDMHRNTWMNHPWVCSTRRSAEENTECVVYATFAIGQPPVDLGANATAELQNEDNERGIGVTVLDVKENMNDGKTPAWFKKAAERFPWATHIAKMDQDAFPHFGNMLARIPSVVDAYDEGSYCPHLYAGSYWSCFRDDDNECPPAHCQFPISGNFLKYQLDSSECYSYMQGAFYLLSRQLAEWVGNAGFWDSDAVKGHAEDATTGLSIKKWAKENGMCIGAVDLAGSFKHLGPMRNSADDFPDWMSQLR